MTIPDFSNKKIFPRCFFRPDHKSPTAVVLSATGLLKPCNYYASTMHLKDLEAWAIQNNLDWKNDLDIKNGIQSVYESDTWQKLISELSGDQTNVPDTCKKECSKQHISNDE